MTKYLDLRKWNKTYITDIHQLKINKVNIMESEFIAQIFIAPLLWYIY